MEKSRKPDRRVAKTKTAIKTAFINLLSEKEMINITVKDVADRADVDRKTVYNYYDGTFAILEELENDFIKLLEEAELKLDFENNKSNPIAIFNKLTEIFNENIELYSKLMKLDSNSQLVAKMNSSLVKKVKDVIIDYANEATQYNVDNTSLFVTAGLIAVYQNWFNSDRSISLEELSKQAGLLVAYGIEGLKKKD